MIQEDVKNLWVKAMREKDASAKDVYSLLLSNIKNKAIEQRVKTLSDADCISVVRKMIKNLSEELDMFKNAGRQDNVDTITRQLELLNAFVPQMLGEDKIVEIISTLDDKSMKSIMTYFKTNYNGKVDMGEVSRIARSM